MHVVVAGSTGVVGREVVAQLSGRSGVTVTALVRRQGSVAKAPNVREVVFDFKADYGRIGGPDLPCDVLICAIGSTMKQAGSKDAFAKIERDIPVALVGRLAELKRGVFGFVSSTGAGKPVGFYLQTKAAVEAAIFAAGVPYVIVRPSLILSERQEFRLGERLATILTVPVMRLAGLVSGRRIAAIGQYMPIAAKTIARALVNATFDSPPAATILEGYPLFDAGRISGQPTIPHL